MHAVVVLSGPSFALEVARELPTAVLAASAGCVQQKLSSGSSRALRSGSWRGSDDVIGVGSVRR